MHCDNIQRVVIPYELQTSHFIVIHDIDIVLHQPIVLRYYSRRHLLLMLEFCDIDISSMKRNPMKVGDTISFEPEAYFEVKTFFLQYSFTTAYVF